MKDVRQKNKFYEGYNIIDVEIYFYPENIDIYFYHLMAMRFASCMSNRVLCKSPYLSTVPADWLEY
ncbi:MAG: hypothetical protein NUV45_12640 [Tepidanaerobacteraceae bacterium]|jgi:hypothetical protein|nr:hypothetical protein [Tepidanaerobacteraceae bacterium]